MVGAVVLVDDDGISDISHLNILINNVPDKRISRPSPSFDSQAIVRTCKCRVYQCNILYASFIRIFSQTSNAVIVEFHQLTSLYSMGKPYTNK